MNRNHLHYISSSDAERNNHLVVLMLILARMTIIICFLLLISGLVSSVWTNTTEPILTTEPQGILIKACPPFCKALTQCDELTGHCLEGCHEGYVGLFCNETCQQHCKSNTQCNQITRQCDEGCQDGYTGMTCNETCSHTCGGHGNCDQTNGVCVEGCKQGFSGEMCEGTNSEDIIKNITCSLNCGGNGECDTKTGDCKHGCKNGFHGSTCTRIDPEATNDTGNKKNNESNKMTTTTQSNLQSKCPDGKYGVNCSNECGKNCGGKRSCEYESGKCLEGCKPGFGGSNCTAGCFYCIDGLCDMKLLTCTKGCLGGNYTLLCDISQFGRNETSSRNIIMYMTLVVLLAVGLLAL